MVLLFFTIVILYGIAIFMPKKITWADIYNTAWFALFFELVVNVYLDLKYDLYGYFERGAQWGTLIVIFGLYPPANAIILNFYTFVRSFLGKAAYIVGIDLICTAYEALATKSGFFYYNGWKWWYSALVYPLIIATLLANFYISRKLSDSARS